MYIGDLYDVVISNIKRNAIRLLNVFYDTKWGCERCGNKYECPDAYPYDVCMVYRKNKGALIKGVRGKCERKGCSNEWLWHIKMSRGKGGIGVEYYLCPKCATDIVKLVKGEI